MRENILLAFGESDQRAALTHDMNGSWYNPETSGQGFNIEILNNNSRILGYWDTYEPSGGQQRWFTFQGDIVDNLATFEIYSTSGGVFVDAQPPEVTVWGTGELEVYGCQSGLFIYQSEAQEVSGEIPLTRLSASTGACVNTNNKTILKTDIP